MVPVSVISYWTLRTPFGSCTTSSSPLKFYSVPYTIPSISQRGQGIGVPWAIWTQTWSRGWVSFKSAERASWCYCEAFYYQIWKVLKTGRGPWQPGKTPNTATVFKKAKNSLGDDQLLRVSSDPWEIMDHILSKVWHAKEGQDDGWEEAE